MLLTGASIFCSGVAAMGAEILWFRCMSVALGGYRAVFSLLLTLLLTSIWLGALLAGRLEQRLRRPMLLLMLSQLGFVLCLLLFTAGYDNRAYYSHFRGLLAQYLDAGESQRELLRA